MNRESNLLKLSYREREINTANLYMLEDRVPRSGILAPSVVDITRFFEPERRRVEDFIKSVYRREYGATIQVDYPILMSVRNEQGDILAAVGFRYAAEETLFLEQYTKQPIEKILECDRSAVCEIGNLASVGQGASVFLYAALSSYLNHKNIRYAVITGTAPLHRHFEKIGLKPQKICDADIHALKTNNQNWGTYYDSKPRVLVGFVDAAVKNLQQALGIEFEDCNPHLYPRLHAKDKI